MAGAGLQPPQRLAGHDRGADRQCPGDRQIGGPQRRLTGARVDHGHHAPPADPPHEGDRAGCRRAHLGALGRRQVGPAVPALPWLGRGIEAAEQLGTAGDRPGAWGSREAATGCAGVLGPGGRVRYEQPAEHGQQQAADQHREPSAGRGPRRQPAAAGRRPGGGSGHGRYAARRSLGPPPPAGLLWTTPGLWRTASPGRGMPPVRARAAGSGIALSRLPCHRSRTLLSRPGVPGRLRTPRHRCISTRFATRVSTVRVPLGPMSPAQPPLHLVPTARHGRGVRRGGHPATADNRA